MWNDYYVPGGTYRENLLNSPGNPGVPDGHPAAKYKYSALKENYADEKGDIFIDRRTASKPEEKTLPIAEKPTVNGVNGKAADVGVKTEEVKASA
jgi:hypothetical protein